jgi:hypothetical protein
MAVRDSSGHWWSRDLRYSWDGKRWLPNRLSFYRVPIPDDLAGVIRGICRVRIAIGLTGAVLAGVPTALLIATGDGLAYLIAAFVAMLTLAFLAIAFFTWRYVRQDMSSGTMIRATGAFTVWHSAIGGDTGSTNNSQIALPDANLHLKNEVAVLLRQHAAVVGRRATFALPLNDVLLFNGSVDYAPKIGLALRFLDSGGRVIWQHPGVLWEYTRLPLW